MSNFWDGLFVFFFYIGGLMFILAIGCIIADYVFPRIPFIERYLESLPDYEDDEDSKVIPFPLDDDTERWGIWAIRSAESVFGASEAWVRVHGEDLIFPSFKEAAYAAEDYNENVGSENLYYMPRAM